jgi:hypothetical protein
MEVLHMSKTVEHLMSSHEVTIACNETLLHAAQLMKQHDVGFLPVMDGEQIIGVITDRDLVIRAIAEQKDMLEEVQKVCTEKIVHIEPEAMLDEAAEKMSRNQVRRLVVSKNGKLHGIITLADLAREKQSDHAAGHALSGISQR